MNSYLLDLFNDKSIIKKIKIRLPYLFQLAELESSRAGKIGMEVGSVREKVITALLIYKYGEKNVESDLPITEPEVDVKLFNQPISIKTVSGKDPTGVKLIWTVDAEKAKHFQDTWYPKYDLIFVHINWSAKGGLYYIPYEVQNTVFDKMGRQGYIRLPKRGTNPRGVEISNDALKAIIVDDRTKSIEINWIKKSINYNPFKRWVDLWSED
ncbi:MAG: ThaI family type II restriction endonuclease [Conexivisphaerales archaeon]